MSKLTKNERIDRLERQVTALTTLLKMKGYKEPEPKLKQLDQSVFDGLDAKWRFAAVDKCGEVWLSTHKTQPSVSGTHLSPEPRADSKHIKGAYDASNWQNSLIERKELTGSDLCRAMLKRGDKAVLCLVIDNKETGEKRYDAITKTSGKSAFLSHYRYWDNAIPINNQGEPLTQSDVGL